MKLITWTELYSSKIFILDYFAVTQDYWDKEKSYSCMNNPTKSSKFLYINNSKAVLKNKNGLVLNVAKGDLIYMPKGSEYEIYFSDCQKNEVHSIVIHFNVCDKSGEDVVFSESEEICFKSDSLLEEFLSLSKEFAKSNHSDLKICGILFAALYRISKEKQFFKSSKKYELIKKGVLLLSQTERNTTVKEAAKVCMISESYFRNLFFDCFKMTPSEYKMNNKMDFAKRLLKSDTLNITQISEKLNFSDIYHFSKTFKKYTGVSPKMFSKMNLD